MLPIFQRALAQYRWQVLGWGGILLLLGLITIPTYDVVLKNPDPIRKMVEQFPPELLAMFARMDQVPDLKKWAETLLPFLSLLGVLLFYGTLAVLLSMLLPARRLAAMAAGMLLVASYFITALAQINSGLKPIAWFSPLEYYQSGHAIRGLKLTWLVGLLAAAALFAILAAWRFEWRDIRVAGEGSWRWPWHKRKPAG